MQDSEFFSNWYNSSHKAFTGTIMVMVATTLTGIAAVVLSFWAAYEMARSFFSDGSDNVMTVTLIVAAVMMGMIIGAGVYYTGGLKEFALAQQSEEDAEQVDTVRRATTGQLVTLVIALPLTLLMPMLLKLSLISFMLLPLLFGVMLNYTAKMARAFHRLRDSGNLTMRNKMGAENLRYTCVLQQRLIIGAFIVLTMMAISLMFISMAIMSAGQGIGAELNSFSIFSIYNILSMAGNSFNAIQIMLTITNILALANLIWTLIWAIPAMVKPIMGWYRMREVPALTSEQPQPTASSDLPPEGIPVPTSFEEPASPSGGGWSGLSDLKPETKEKPDEPKESVADENEDDEEDYEDSRRRKWWYIGAGVAAAALVAAFLLWPDGKMKMEVKAPKWEQFVIMTSDNVTMYQEPSRSANTLMEKEPETWREPIEYSWTGGADYNEASLPRNFILPVVGEEDDWYKLFFNGEFTVYVPKRKCSIIEPIDYHDDIFSDYGNVARVPGSDGLFLGWYDDTGNWSPHFVQFGRQFGKGILWTQPYYDGIVMEYAREVCQSAEYCNWFDADMFTEQGTEQFISAHPDEIKFDRAMTYCFSHDGHDFIGRFEFSLNTYPHDMATETWAFAQSGEATPHAAANEQHDVTMQGRVHEYPVTMTLHFDGNAVTGSYYYASQGPDKVLRLAGVYDGTTIDIYETDEDGSVTGHFNGRYAGGVFQGDFTNSQGNQMYFRVEE